MSVCMSSCGPKAKAKTSGPICLQFLKNLYFGKNRWTKCSFTIFHNWPCFGQKSTFFKIIFNFFKPDYEHHLEA